MKMAGEKNYFKLSLAAKTHVILGSKKGPISSSDIREHASDFGWKVTDSEIGDAVDLLRKLKLSQAPKGSK